LYCYSLESRSSVPPSCSTPTTINRNPTLQSPPCGDSFYSNPAIDHDKENRLSTSSNTREMSNEHRLSFTSCSTTTRSPFTSATNKSPSIPFNNSNHIDNPNETTASLTSSNNRNSTSYTSKNNNTAASTTGADTNSIDIPDEVCEFFKDSEEDLEMACLLEQSYFKQHPTATSTNVSSKTPNTSTFKKGLNISNSGAVSSTQQRSFFSSPPPKKNTLMPNDGDNGMQSL